MKHEIKQNFQVAENLQSFVLYEREGLTSRTSNWCALI